MNKIKKELIVLDKEGGPLRAATTALSEVDFFITATDDIEWMKMLLQNSTHFAALLVNGAVVSEAEGRELFAEVCKDHDYLPVLWLCSPEFMQPNFGNDLPARVVPARSATDAIVGELRGMLTDRFFPPIVKGAIEFGARHALQEVFATEMEVAETLLRDNSEALAATTAIVSFYGPTTNGQLVVAASKETLGSICDKVMPPDRQENENEVDEMAGDICNTVIGKLKAFFEMNDVDLSIAWPVMTRGYPTSLTYGVGRLSLVLRLHGEVGDVFVELCLDRFDVDAIKENVHVMIMAPGTLEFF